MASPGIISNTSAVEVSIQAVTPVSQLTGPNARASFIPASNSKNNINNFFFISNSTS